MNRCKCECCEQPAIVLMLVTFSDGVSFWVCPACEQACNPNQQHA